MFGRKLRGKLPSFNEPTFCKEEMKDRISVKAEKEKEYFNKRRHARVSDIEKGSQVLVKQDRKNKLSTYYNPVPYAVIDKNGNSVTLKTPSGSITKRNSSFLKKYQDPEQEETDRENESDNLKQEATIPENLDSRNKPTVSTREVDELPDTSNPELPELPDQTDDGRTRPKRNRKLPSYYKDFVMN